MSTPIRALLHEVKTTTTPDDYFKRLRRAFRAKGLAYQRDGNTINFPNDDCHMIVETTGSISWVLNPGLVGTITKKVAGGDEATREQRRAESATKESTPRERKIPGEKAPRKHKDRAGRGTEVHADYIVQTREARGRQILVEMVNTVIAENHLSVSDQTQRHTWLTFDARRLYQQFSTNAEVVYYLRDRWNRRGIQPTQICFMPLGDDVNFLIGFGPMDSRPHMIHTHKLVQDAGGDPTKIPDSVATTFPEPQDGMDGEPILERRTIEKVLSILPNEVVQVPID